MEILHSWLVRLLHMQEVGGSSPSISTKRELSEHHYHRTVGSDSFFVKFVTIKSIKTSFAYLYETRLYTINCIGFENSRYLKFKSISDIICL